jgi:hypothetical protein
MNIELSFLSYEGLFLSGLALVFFWAFMHLLSFIWTLVWKWVDDAEYVTRSPLVLFMMTKVFNFEPSAGVWGYRKVDGNGKSDGEWQSFFLPMLVLGFMPVILKASLDFYPLTVTVGTTLLIAFLSRFGRRQVKLFKEHTKDKNAHN